MADAAVAALNSLLRRASIDDPDEALRLANDAIKAAKASPADLLTAQHTKVVALLKLDRFDDVLRTIADAGDALARRCPLERAYALYKTGHLDDAAALSSAAADGDIAATAARGLRHVGAQAAYRSERFDDAAAQYRRLLGDEGEGGQAGEEGDVRVNLLAAQAQLELAGRGARVPPADRQPAREDLEAFEPAYNAACACLGRGDFARATVLLKRARDLCAASEELSEDEKRAELLPIQVQQVYALARQGKTDEAAALHDAIDLSEYVPPRRGPPPC